MLNSIIESLDEAILAYDSDLVVRVMNKSAREILSVPETSFKVGEPFEKLVRYWIERGGYRTWGEDDDVFEWRMNAARSFEPRTQEIVSHNGRDISYVGRPIPGGIYVVTMTDITDRKKAKREAENYRNKFRQLLDYTHEGYWHIDPDGKTMEVNPALCDLLGRTAEEFVELTIYDLVDEENADVFRRQLELRKQGIRAPYEITLRHADGHGVTLINNPAPIYDESGKQTGSIGLWTDITELKAANLELAEAKAHLEYANTALKEEVRSRLLLNEELRRAKEDLEEKVEQRTQEVRQALERAQDASEAKTNFLANMSHELRTPLNAVLGFSDLMLAMGDRLTVPAAQSYAGHIHQGGNHLLDLINALLDMVRIEAGKYEPDIGEFNILDEVDMVCQLAKSTFASRRQELVCDHGELNEQTTIEADARAVRQILFNLLSNASKHSPMDSTIHGGIDVRGTDVRIVIRDQGPGIPADKLETVFERFVQLNDPLLSGAGGLGIGLALSRELAEANGGKLELRSQVGAGTEAILYLPRRGAISPRGEAASLTC